MADFFGAPFRDIQGMDSGFCIQGWHSVCAFRWLNSVPGRGFRVHSVTHISARFLNSEPPGPVVDSEAKTAFRLAFTRSFRVCIQFSVHGIQSEFTLNSTRNRRFRLHSVSKLNSTAFCQDSVWDKRGIPCTFRMHSDCILTAFRYDGAFSVGGRNSVRNSIEFSAFR